MLHQRWHPQVKLLTHSAHRAERCCTSRPSKCSQIEASRGHFWRLCFFEFDLVRRAPGRRVQAQCFGAPPSWTGIRKRSGKKKRRARSKPSEVECRCARCCGCMRFLPSAAFSFPVYLIGCCLNAGHADWQAWRWLPPRNEVAERCQGFVARFPMWAHLLSVKFMIPSLLRWPS